MSQLALTMLGDSSKHYRGATFNLQTRPLCCRNVQTFEDDIMIAIENGSV